MATELPTVSEPERAERCETCKWWEGDFDDSREGLCRRYPPVYAPVDVPGGDEEPWYRPVTSYDNFCGEWRAK
jgi:hypothetical protein